MQFRNFPLCHGYNWDALKPHLHEKGRDMFLIPAEAVETFGYDDFEIIKPGVFQKPLIARAKMRCSAQSSVGKGLGLLPTIAIDQAQKQPMLVLNGGVTLKIGGVAGVDSGAHGSGRSALGAGWPNPL